MILASGIHCPIKNLHYWGALKKKKESTLLNFRSLWRVKILTLFLGYQNNSLQIIAFSSNGYIRYLRYQVEIISMVLSNPCTVQKSPPFKLYFIHFSKLFYFICLYLFVCLFCFWAIPSNIQGLLLDLNAGIIVMVLKG